MESISIVISISIIISKSISLANTLFFSSKCRIPKSSIVTVYRTGNIMPFAPLTVFPKFNLTVTMTVLILICAFFLVTTFIEGLKPTRRNFVIFSVGRKFLEKNRFCLTILKKKISVGRNF